MKRLAAVLPTIVVFGLCLAACGDDSDKASTTSASTVAPGGATGGGSMKLATTSLGKILTDDNGMTVYLFTLDTPTSSACTTGCDSTWPPVIGPVKAGDGLDAGQFGTLARDDGKIQATYFGHPLYTYSGDSKAGDTNGQGSGGKWFAVTATGTQAKAGATGPTPTTKNDGYAPY